MKPLVYAACPAEGGCVRLEERDVPGNVDRHRGANQYGGYLSGKGGGQFNTTNPKAKHDEPKEDVAGKERERCAGEG